MARQVKKSSWIVPIVACSAAVGLLAVWDTWFSPVPPLAGFIAFALVAVGFLYAYLTEPEQMWWAIIPALSATSLIATLATEVLTGAAPSNDWASVAVFGVGMAFTGAVLKRVDAKTVLYVVAMITLGVAALMTPIVLWMRVLLALVDVAAWTFAILAIRAETPAATGTGTRGLTPHT